MRAVHSLIFLVTLSACLIAPVRAADTAHDADVAAIRAVVQQFQAAIIAHDGKTLDKLFLADHDSWLEVADAATYADVKTRHPDAHRVMRRSRKDFVEFVQDAPKPVEERFSNVRIDTNGSVGSVYFDFDFLSDGKLNNRGSETWQMVHAEDGWKIGSMLYSIGR
jgi:hypothetical protein